MRSGVENEQQAKLLLELFSLSWISQTHTSTQIQNEAKGVPAMQKIPK